MAGMVETSKEDALQLVLPCASVYHVRARRISVDSV